MRSKKFLALMLALFSFLMTPPPALAAGAQTITFTITTADGNVLGSATVPASEALGSSLSSFFVEVAAAVRKVIAAIEAKQEGAAAQASEDAWVSSNVKVNILGIGTGSSAGGGGGGGGGGGCNPSVATCN